MGVQGLWKLLEAAGKPIPVEKLENKILSIDVSIWLYQIIKGVQENDHGALTNTHLIVMFHRICKLLFYGIKPVFIFDGGVPELKRMTIAQRQAQKRRAKKSSTKTKEKLLINMLEQAALKTVMNANGDKMTEEEVVKKTVNTLSKPDETDLFELPTLPDDTEEVINKANSVKTESQHSSANSSYSESDNLLMMAVDNQDNESLYNGTDKGKPSVKLNTFSSLQIDDLLKKHADDQKRMMDRKKTQKSKQEMTVSEMEMFLNSSDGLDDDIGEKLKSDSDTLFYYQSDFNNKASTNTNNSLKPLANNESATVENTEPKNANQHPPNSVQNNETTSLSDDDDLFKALNGDESLEEDRIAWLAFNENKKASKKRSVEFESSTTKTKNASESSANCDYPEEMHITDMEQDVLNTKFLSNKHANKSLFLDNDPNEILTYDLLNEDHLAWLALNRIKSEQNPTKLHDTVTSSASVASTSTSVSNNSKCVSNSWDDDSVIDLKLDYASKSLYFDSDSDDDLDNGALSKDVTDYSLNKNSSFNFADESKAINLDELIRKTEIEELAMTWSSPNKTSLTNKIEKIDSSVDIFSKINAISADKLVSPRKHVRSATVTSGEVAKDLLIKSAKTSSVDVVTAQKEEANPLDEQYLLDVQESLVKRQNELVSLERTSNRMASSVSQKITSEMKILLRMFGIPYITAPMEAEAQCAFLEKIGRTDGTVTDDSDIWLFGANVVFKDFFDSKKYVRQFRSDDIKHKFGLSQNNLIQLAFLVGSDYTRGIDGIGPVTAIEMLSFFESKTKYRNIEDKLLKIKEIVNSKSEVYNDIPFVKKLKSVKIGSDFPNKAVINAYLNPIVNESDNKLSWGVPHVEMLLKYAQTNFDWNVAKTQSTLAPIMKKIAERTNQKTLDSYMRVLPILSDASAGMSKRVSHAVKRLRDNGNTSASAESDVKSAKLRKLTASIEANKVATKAKRPKKHVKK
ncbi:DNA excision repair protein ERCC-5 [Adelges cooleyi]|uniref:DNA excision repair protein ERCC-5 n=1 Tax=Adelges cooleyi TaxID=133065 RepID=UPI00217FEBAF|nr:DNA excision repair protein ERCC-5 [Adelges cooleyi]